MFTMDVGKTWTSTRAFNSGPRAAYEPEAPASAVPKRTRPGSVYDRNIKSLGEFMPVPAPPPRSQQSLRGSMGGSMRLPSAAETSSIFGPAAGAAPEKLGGVGSEHAAIGSRHFQSLSQGRTEEERRQLLVTGERRRRGAHLKYKPTDTLGLKHQQELNSAAAAASFYQKQQQRAMQQQPPQQRAMQQPQPQPQQQQQQQQQQPQPWQQQLPLIMGTAAPASIPGMTPPAMAAGAGGVAGAVEPKRQSSMSRTFLPVMGADLDDKIRCSY